MKTEDFYKGELLTIMKKARQSNFNKNLDRIDEIIAFAKNNEFKRIGIAKCAELSEEGRKLEEILKSEGFEVFSIDCNYGKDQISDIKEHTFMTCNPKAQAIFLEKNNTEMNIIAGLCLGHDIIFNKESKALVTTLYVKDRKYNHHTLARFAE